MHNPCSDSPLAVSGALAAAELRARNHGLEQAAQSCPRTTPPLVQLGLYMGADGMPAETMTNALQSMEESAEALSTWQSTGRWVAGSGLLAVAGGLTLGWGRFTAPTATYTQALPATAGLAVGLAMLLLAWVSLKRRCRPQRQAGSLAEMISQAVQQMQSGTQASEFEADLPTVTQNALTTYSLPPYKTDETIPHRAAATRCRETALTSAANLNPTSHSAS